MDAFNSLASVKPTLAAKLTFLLGPIWPGLFLRLPNERKQKTWAFMTEVGKFAAGVLERQIADKDAASREDLDQSIVGSVGE